MRKNVRGENKLYKEKNKVYITFNLQEVNDKPLDKTKIFINWLMNGKASESNGIPADLIKYGGAELYEMIYELISDKKEDNMSSSVYWEIL